MNASRSGKTKLIVRPAVAIGVCVALGTAGITAGRILSSEDQEAAAFVAEGQRALSHDERAAGVLALKRAQLLAPRSGSVRAAVSAAEVKDAEPLAARVVRLLTAREWFAIAIACGWLSGLALASIVARRKNRGVRGAALAGGAGFVLACAGLMVTNSSSPAVVVGPETRLVVAPYAATTVEALPPGTVVVVGPVHDRFVRVEDGGGTEGWVERSNLERVAGGES